MTQDYNIDLIPLGIQPIVKISQYDRESRVLSFHIFENGKPYAIPTDATVTFRGTKPDKKGFEYICTKSGNVVSIPVRVQMSVVAGAVECEIRITQGTKIIGTQNLTLMVEKSALADDTDTSESDFPTVETVTQTAMDVKQSASNAQQSAKEAKQSAEEAKKYGSNVIDVVYPVGSIYFSMNNINPSKLFGVGTWERIAEGRTLIGASSKYAAGAVGGEESHKLTVGEMPSHTHTFTGTAVTSGNQSANHTHSFSGTTSSNGSHTHELRTSNSEYPYSTYSKSTATGGNQWSFLTLSKNRVIGEGNLNIIANGSHTHSVSGTTGNNNVNHTHSVTAKGTNSSTGSGQAHNNMQPYLVTYIWQRTA